MSNSKKRSNIDIIFKCVLRKEKFEYKMEEHDAFLPSLWQKSMKVFFLPSAGLAVLGDD